MKYRSPKVIVAALVLVLVTSSVFAGNVLVRTAKPYDSVKAKIAALGGTITYEFKNANGLAVSIGDDKLAALKATPGVTYAIRDLTVPNPAPKDRVDITDQVETDGGVIEAPANYYSYGSELTNSFTLHNAGHFGNGVVVGVIDSGTSNSVSALCADATTTANCVATSRVIGGENFVPGASEPGPNSSLNDPHGTWVATVIGANRVFGFTSSSSFARAIRAYCNPVSTIPCSTPASPTVDAVNMVGQAPAARFYALKVFPASGGGAPESRILQAMDRAIQLKQTTQPSMKVVNMSLGGATLFASADIEDELAASMAANGITLVASAGNEGPSGGTVGSPGTAKNILTVGAANSAVHERILRDLQFGFGIGPLYRPDSSQQIAYFSSRGPNADGRPGPNVVANGFGSFAQGASGGISLVSGTSFSAPTVSGVATLLHAAFPSATPSDVRAAILRSARPNIISTATVLDQGFGYVDAAGARALLTAGPVAPVSDQGPAKGSVRQNVQIGAGISPIESSFYTTHVAGLRPAERREFFYVVKKNTAAVRVFLLNITPANAPAQQNQFFGDDILFSVQGAKTSTDSYFTFDFFASNASFEYPRPETGLMRVTVNGDWTNVGTISADLAIQEVAATEGPHTFKEKIQNGESKEFNVSIPAGTTSASFALSWAGDWGSYPTSDLDMILISPTNVVNVAGATLNSPERATIANPTPGTWTILVDGFTVFGKDDAFEVRVDY